MIVEDQGKERRLLFSEAWQIQFICGGQRRQRGQVEIFQSCRQHDLDAFQRFGAAGMIVLVLLHGDMVGLPHFIEGIDDNVVFIVVKGQYPFFVFSHCYRSCSL